MRIWPYILIQQLLLYYQAEAPLKIGTRARHLKESKRYNFIYTIDQMHS